MITIKYLNKEFYFKKKTKIKEILNNIQNNVKNKCIGVIIKKKIFEINSTIKKSTKIDSLIYINTDIGRKIIRTACSFIIGNAIKNLWPNSKKIKSKNTNYGFLYDFENNRTISIKDKKKIKKEMLSIIKKKIHKKKVPINKIKNILKKQNEKYTLKKIQNIKKKNKLINICINENYLDLYNGLSINNIKKFIKNFKISSISGLKKKNKKNIQRINCIVWENKNKIKEYTNKIKKNKTLDHRKINNKLKLFHINEKSPGMIFWHNNGLLILQNIKNMLRKKLDKYGYTEVQSANMIDINMWKKSGHYKNYNKFIFTTISEQKKLCIKPMNCLGHIDIYKQEIKSYKDLPIRFSEFGICHRNEASGALHGLMRTKSFTQDDAHIFCTKKQVDSEILKCIDLTQEIYKIFNFKKINIFLSTKPQKYIGNIEKWKKSEKQITKILKKNKIYYKIKKGEGAFYGPKIEFVLQDSLKREWQCGTIQLDLFLSKKLNVYFINKNNEKKHPIIIHRAILGSLERFIGILIEEKNGWLPLWLTPIQIIVLNITKNHVTYCKNILNKLKINNIRAKGDFRNKKINFKIREYTLQKIPYMIICGDNELLLNTINVRKTIKKKTNHICLEKFIKKIKIKIKKK